MGKGIINFEEDGSMRQIAVMIISAFYIKLI